MLFQAADGSEELIAEVETEEDANKATMKFLDDHNIKPHYLRYWGDPETGVTCDYGSHNSFIVLRY